MVAWRDSADEQYNTNHNLTMASTTCPIKYATFLNLTIRLPSTLNRGSPEPVHQHERAGVAEGDEAGPEARPGGEDVPLPGAHPRYHPSRRVDHRLDY